LHAKCLKIDKHIVYVGSANWYRYSLEKSREILLRGDVNLIDGRCAELENLWDQGQEANISRKTPAATAPETAGITHEVADPLAVEVLKKVPKSFILRKKY
jgi:phosphatidylserine/phosphatidylglycerophosphate/cardiolipin synthase-like enzyme